MHALEESETLIDVLERRAESEPQRTAFEFLRWPTSAQVEREQLTYERLLTRARAIAARLQKEFSIGDRVLILLPPGLAYVEAFFGCQFAGLVAVPAHPPRNQSNLGRLQAIARDCGAAVVIAATNASMKRWDAPDLPPVLAIDTFADSETVNWRAPKIGPGDLAFLQYTSGTTGTAKGVMVEHRNIIANFRCFSRRCAFTPEDVSVSWLPPYHDLGLITGILQPVWFGAKSVLMAPESFLADSKRWLWALSEYRAAVTAAPNFAYQRCIEIDVIDGLDLSKLRLAGIGAEPPRIGTMDRFADHFAAAGFSRASFCPGYGLAETTLMVTNAACGAGPRVRALQDQTPGMRDSVSNGAPLEGHEIKIVDPKTRHEVSAGQVGEICVKGPTVARGYWARLELTEQVFNNRLIDLEGTDMGGYLRTGDRGALVDGELYVAGRIKDLIKIRGRNHYAQDVEAAAAIGQPLLSADSCAAFGVERADEERLVVLCEVPRRRSGFDNDATLAAIRKSILEQHEVEPHAVALVSHLALPRTTSGKLQRSLARDMYENGTIKVLAALAPATAPPGNTRKTHDVLNVLQALSGEALAQAVRRHLLSRLCAAANETLPPDFDDLAGIGLDSMKVTELVAQLNDELNLQPALEAVSIFEEPNLTALTATVVNALGCASDAGSAAALSAMRDTAADATAPFPLTDTQTAYLVGRERGGSVGDVSCFAFFAVTFPNLDVARLENAFGRVIAAHPMLRATIGEGFTQRILPSVPRYQVPIIDLSQATDAEGDWQNLIAELAQKRLPPDHWPLFESRAVVMPDGETRFTLGVDLLICDAASIGIMFGDLLAAYGNDAWSPHEPKIRFRDIAAAHAARKTGAEYERARTHWQRRLAEMPLPPALPLMPDVESQSTRFGRRQFRLDRNQWSHIKARAMQARTTSAAVFLTAYTTVIGTWSESDDFSVQVTVADRATEAADVIGDFTAINMLEVRDARSGPFSERARRLHRRVMKDLEHRAYSGINVLRDLEQVRGVKARPLAVFTSLLGAPSLAKAAGLARNLGIEILETRSQTPQVVIDCQAREDDGEVVISWDAPESCFRASSLDDMFDAFRYLVLALAAERADWNSSIQPALPDWQCKLMSAANATAGTFPSGRLEDDIVAYARQNPDRPAILGVSGELDETLSYGALIAHASSVQQTLATSTEGDERLIAIVMEKGWQQIAAAIGILRDGRAFLPVNTADPDERIRAICSDAGVRTLITTEQWQSRFSSIEGVRCIVVNSNAQDNCVVGPDPVSGSADDLAYVIYTSGSTGRPKGVMINHAAALNTLHDIRTRFGVGEDDRVLWVSELSFDLSIFDIFGVLGAGGAVVVPRPGLRSDPASMAASVARHQVTIWNSVPALADLMLSTRDADANLSSLRLAMLSGDWIALALPDRIREAAPQCSVVGLGGATEASIWSISYRVGQVDRTWPSIPYGKPLRNQTFHVLKPDFAACPVFVPGKLYIGGAGLAEGYLNDHDKTLAKFVTTPDGERLYDTGDIGRYLADGNIEFLGRCDHQVKIRGYRIELGEVEAAVTAAIDNSDVEVVVAAKKGADSVLRLVAYLAATHTTAIPSEEELRALLSARLPEHMIPAAFVTLPEFPLSSNGKIDRTKLPDPAFEDTITFVAPATDLEKLVCKLFEELTGVSPVGCSHNFFQVGGHSILAAQLAAQTRSATGKNIAVRHVFENPTPGALADFLKTSAPSETVMTTATSASEAPILSLAEQSLLMMELLAPGAASLNSVALFRIMGRIDTVALEQALQSVVERHQILRTRYQAESDGSFRPVVGPAGSVRLSTKHLPCVTTAELEERAQQEAAAPINCFSGPIFRACLLSRTEEESVLLIVVHHIAMDALSGAIVWTELSEAYGAIRDGKALHGTAMPAQYRDFAAWEAGHIEREPLKQFWIEHMAGAPACHDLPFDHDRPRAVTDDAGAIIMSIPPNLAAGVAGLAARENSTLFLVLETAVAALCAMLSSADEIVIGTAVDGRHRHGPAFDKTVGLFVNTAPLRHAIDRERSFAGHLKAARTELLSVLEHADLPFHEIVAAVNPQRSAAFDPIFQIFCQLRAAGVRGMLKFGEASVEPIPSRIVGRGADLAFVFDQHQRGLELQLSYNSKLFERRTVEAIAKLYLRLLENVAARPEEALGSLWAQSSDLPSQEVPRENFARAASWYPLSAAQRDVWFADQSAPEGSSFVSLATLTCAPEINQDALRLAIADAIARSQSQWLRLSGIDAFQSAASQPMVELEEFVLTVPLAGDDQPTAVLDWHEARTTDGDTRGGVAIFRAPDATIVALRSHHLWNDGFSVVRGFETVSQNYERILKGESRFAQTDRKFLPTLRGEMLYRGSAAARADEDFWRANYSGLDDGPILFRLADRPQNIRAARKSHSVRRTFSAAVQSNIDLVAKHLGLSVAELLTALTGFYLARFVDSEAVTFATPFINRDRRSLAVPGQFAKAIPVRMKFLSDATLAKNLIHAAAVLREAVRHGRFPFGEILQTCRLDPRHADVSVNTLLLRQRLHLGDQPASVRWLSGPEAGLGFLWTRFGQESPLELELRFNESLFDFASVARHADRLTFFLDAALEAIDQPSADLPAMSPEERDLVVSAFNKTTREIHGPRTLAGLLAEQAVRTPDSAAVVGAGVTIRYDELHRRADALASSLVDRGAAPGKIVAVWIPRSQEMAVALLAVVKSGAAYLPLATDGSHDRQLRILKASGAALLITTGSVSVELQDDLEGIPDLDIVTVEAMEGARQPVATRPARQIRPSDPAYIIFTSGSTGDPKGVVISNAAVTNYLAWAAATYAPLEGCSSTPLHTSIAFDLAVTALWLPLVTGAAIDLLSNDDPLTDLADRLAKRPQWSFLKLTPSHLRGLAGVDIAGGAKKVIVGGEALSSEQLIAWTKTDGDVQIVNEYGPTEATVGCAAYIALAKDLRPGTVPIGLPIWNTELYILDRKLSPVPIGAVGELWIGGDGLADGYLGRPDLTAERFVPCPFGAPDKRMYRSGDLARWHSPGEIEYLGRADDQIKISGMRIEPREVETNIRSVVPGIDAVAVIGLERESRVPVLVAYASCRRNHVLPGIADLRTLLAKNLPDAMIPSAIIAVDHLPLTANGKLDRRALPAPTFEDQSPYAPPSDEIEDKFCRLFEEITGTPNVGIHQRFFDIGGTSMAASVLVRRARESGIAELVVRDVFSAHSPMELARVVRQKRCTIAALAPEEKNAHQGMPSAAQTLTEDHQAAATDLVLPRDIAPLQLSVRRAATRPRRILLTGGTGFLGREIITRLFSTGDVEITCLVRAPSDDMARQRLKAALAADGRTLEAASVGMSTNAISANLEEKYFGLDEGQIEALVGSTDLILHNGAEVNFAADYARLRGANVIGTREVIRLAGRAGAPVHFVSSASVFDTAELQGIERVGEEELPETSAGFRDAYALSKWVGERNLRTARARGLQVAVYRPGFITGNSKTGYYPPGDLFTHLVRLATILGAIPSSRFTSYLTPVDYVADAIATMALSGDSLGATLHLVAPQRTSAADLAQWMRTEGYTISEVTITEWLERLREFSGRTASDPASALRDLLVTGPEDLTNLADLDTTTADDLLARHAIRCPRVDADLFGKYLRSLQQNGFVFANRARADFGQNAAE